MRITDEVVVDAAPGAVFAALTDPAMAAPCLPGAWVQDDANGRRAADGRARPAGLTVRVGPVSPAYRGTVRVLAVDRDARRLVLAARGRDERDDADVGPASARLELAVSPGPGGTGTLLHLDADLVVRGRVARCGRGVLGEVCRDLAVRFARALGELVATQPVPGRAPDTALTAAPHVRSRGGLRLPSRVTGAAVASVAVAALGVAALVAAVMARARGRPRRGRRTR